jgi:carbamate kinase
MTKFAVVAIGGNSLIKDKNHQKVEDQYDAILETAAELADIVEAGYQLVVTHGNGPQVGFIQRRSEIAYKTEGMHMVPLVSCVADTQGAIGYQIQQALNNEFKKRSIIKPVVTLITMVKVDKNDPAFAAPNKPIGTFIDAKDVEKIKKAYPNWILVEDSGRGFRRVVPSPKPIEIIEQKAIMALINEGFCVIAGGGGGIPVIEKENGDLEGIDAVIDKDFLTADLAVNLKADLLIISTGVDHVCLNFGSKNEKKLSKISLNEIKQFINEGHFAAGSMLPKIQAVVSFLEKGGKQAIITHPNQLKEALTGKVGTHIFSKRKI